MKVTQLNKKKKKVKKTPFFVNVNQRNETERGFLVPVHTPGGNYSCACLRECISINKSNDWDLLGILSKE